MAPDHAAFPLGTQVRIAPQEVLEEFRRTWAFHNKLQSEQLRYARQLAVVEDIGYYHGGDPLYRLHDVPELWHECCLRLANPGKPAS
jgi:hypothetical protein